MAGKYQPLYHDTSNIAVEVCNILFEHLSIEIAPT